MPGRHAHALRAPERFGKYELLEVVGKGGMAEVFLARATGPKGFARELAIKRILAHMSSDEEFVEMFVAEAKLSGSLAHGNIVPIFEFGEVDGQLFLAMEYVDGVDLRSLLRRQRLAAERLRPEVAVHVAVEVLRGLGYAHARKGEGGQPLGLVHRDVSPSNILVSRAGEVKLCDFGIAKAATRHTTSGRLKGKFSYMSPEQARGKPLDSRSDLFSVGILLWEMLSGVRLFQGDSDLSVLDQVREAQIPQLPRLGVPGEDKLREVVHRALQPDPAQRYADAGSFAAPLRAFLAQAHDLDPARELERIVATLVADPAPPIASAETTPASGVVPVEDSEARAPAPPAHAEPTALLPDPSVASAETILHPATHADVALPDRPRARVRPARGVDRRLLVGALVAVVGIAVGVIVVLATGDDGPPPPRITATPLGHRDVSPAASAAATPVLAPPPVLPAQPARPATPAVVAPAPVVPAPATPSPVRATVERPARAEARPAVPPRPAPAERVPPAEAPAPAAPAPSAAKQVRTVDPFALQR